MIKNVNAGNRTGRLFFVFTILVFIISLLSLNIVYGESNTSLNDNLDMKTRIGIGGVIKNNILTPVEITLSNNNNIDIGATLKLLKGRYDGKKTYIVEYKKSILLKANSNSSYSFDCELKDADTINIIVTQDNGKILLMKNVNKVETQSHDRMIGIITEDEVEINKVVGTNRTIRHANHTFNQVEDRFLEKVSILKNFDIIVLNRFNPDAFTKNQIRNLKMWIAAGGEIIIGSSIDNKSPHDMYTDLLGAGSWNYSRDKIVFNSSNYYNVNYKEVNYDRNIKGNITILDYEKDYNIDFIIRNILEENYYQQFKEYGLNQNNYITEYIPVNEIPSTRLIIILFLIFPLMVGPVSYIVLKKMDKREYIWLCIPVISVVFFSALYILGLNSNMSNPTINSLTLVEVDKYGEASFIRECTINAFEYDDMKIMLDKETDLLNESTIPNTNIKNGTIALRYDLDAKTGITYPNKTRMETAKLSTVEYRKLGDGIKLYFDIKGESIVGSIINGTYVDIYDGVIIFNDYFLKVGDIQAGEKIDEIVLELRSKNKVGEFYSNVYPNKHESGHNILNEGIMESMLMTIAQRDVLQENNINFIGWSDRPIASEIVLNNAPAKRIDRNMILSYTPIGYIPGEKITNKNNSIKPVIVEMKNVEITGNNFRGDGHIVMKFDYPDNIIGSKLKIDFTRSKMNKDYIIIEIFNNKTKRWDIYNKNMLIKEDSKADKYYSSTNGILVRFKLRKYQYCAFPKFGVEGVVKDVKAY